MKKPTIEELRNDYLQLIQEKHNFPFDIDHLYELSGMARTLMDTAIIALQAGYAAGFREGQKVRG